jgi:hypothetical protein
VSVRAGTLWKKIERESLRADTLIGSRKARCWTASCKKTSPTYGAFIDLGGIDGSARTSRIMSWGPDHHSRSNRFEGATR